MNQTLANQAVRAITDDSFEREGTFCQRFVRQVVQAVYGDQFDEYWADSAKHTAANFVHGGLEVDGPPELGDLLYLITGHGGFGHVGVFVSDDRVAENSVTPIGRVSGAKGFRTLAQFGEPDVIVRLADPVAAWTVRFGDGQELSGREEDGHVWVPVRQWAGRLGLRVTWDDVASAVSLGGHVVTAPVVMGGGSAWCKVADLAGLAGLQIDVDAANRRLAVHR